MAGSLASKLGSFLKGLPATYIRFVKAKAIHIVVTGWKSVY